MLESIIYAIIGGLFIGLSASLLMLSIGRDAGISGIVGSLMQPKTGETGWKLAMLAGMFLGGTALAILAPTVYEMPAGRSLLAVGVAGLLVGFGTRMGNGCTSGHGVCGLSRLSIRSLAATMTFMGTGFATATAIQMFSGGAL
jgi:uncharacterized protein